MISRTNYVTLLKADEYSEGNRVPLISVGEIGNGAIRIGKHTPFIAWQFQRNEIKLWLVQNSSGSTMASMNQEILKWLSFPIPELAEQIAIVTILSDIGSEITALELRPEKTRLI